MKIYAFIFARGGSKGILKKNIREFAGKPLIKYSIDFAKKFKNIDEVFVSTDSAEIKEISIKNGAKVIDRPSKLSKDDSPEWLAWKHAINWTEKNNYKFDIFLSLPTTSPLRGEKDVQNCLDSFSSSIDAVICVSNSNRSPWFNMAKLDKKGYLKILLGANGEYIRRQDTPVAYDLTTVAYVTRPSYIKKSESLFNGKVKGVVVPIERSIDIDTELDFEIAEFLMKKKENGSEN